jgi:DNA-binding transcriptional MocR family regulator
VSKTLAPGFRTAWIAAAAPIAGKLEIAKQAADLCTSSLDQRIVHEAIATGVLAAHLPRLRQFYGERRTVMEQTLRAELGSLVSWLEPRGGFFLWATLPPPLDAPVLLDRAMAHGVIFVSGHAFFVDGAGHDRIRLAFSLPSPATIAEGVRRLSSAIREALAAGAAPTAPGAPSRA